MGFVRRRNAYFDFVHILKKNVHTSRVTTVYSHQVRSDDQPGEESCLCKTFILMVLTSCLASTLIGIFSCETLRRQACVLLSQSNTVIGGASKLRNISKMIEGNGRPSLLFTYHSKNFL